MVLLFRVGDKVVYPMHGAGVIEAIEEREVLGNRKHYYVMKLPLGEMEVMVPTGSEEECGLRSVVNQQKLQQVFELLRQRRSKMPGNWSHRYRAHLAKMRSGDIMDLAEVVCNLSQRNQERGLSTGERKMLDNARQILLSEIVLAMGVRVDEASEILDGVLVR